MPIQQAQQLGRYYLLDRVAFGGMAEIFRAKTRDAQGKELLVAVKRVLAHLCEDDEFIQMLIDEARLTALLKHNNIARVYEFSKVGSEYFIAMEYVEGKDMRALLERARQNQEWLAEDLIAYIGMQVALGLHFAYEQVDRDGTPLHIVHRDVSPSNVLLSYSGDVKLCDFGIAKAEGARQQTRTGVIKGKVKYMSPEQAMGRKLDHRSDLFSLGTVLYEMLTLQAPFLAPTEVELIFAVRDARKTPVRELSPEVPEELQRIVDRAMTRSRTARYQSGEEMADELRRFLETHYPGYRRAHFSHFMRRVFEAEIDKELRQAEAFVIDQADAGQVGVNLIADALGPDAPFTRFTPIFGAGPPGEVTDYTGDAEIHPADLHGQATMLFDRQKLGLPPMDRPRSDYRDGGITAESPPKLRSASLHELETRLLDHLPPRAAGELDTGDRELPTNEGYRRQGQAETDLHDRPTRLLHTLLVDGAPPGGGHGFDLHDMETRILSNPLLLRARTPLLTPTEDITGGAEQPEDRVSSLQATRARLAPSGPKTRKTPAIADEPDTEGFPRAEPDTAGFLRDELEERDDELDLGEEDLEEI